MGFPSTANLGRGNAQPFQLAALGLAHRQEPRGARQHLVPDRAIEEPLGQDAPLDTRRGAPWLEQIGNAARSEMARGQHPQEMVAAVQVRDVEAAGVAAQEAVEP